MYSRVRIHRMLLNITIIMKVIGAASAVSGTLDCRQWKLLGCLGHEVMNAMKTFEGNEGKEEDTVYMKITMHWFYNWIAVIYRKFVQ
ncbi:hypothetical protein BD769DRAFT_1417809 [Suillus cothurnatus]|nr:hypothetical protein BD769DRAFT_1417809 [Suillus cothurnatus]